MKVILVAIALAITGAAPAAAPEMPRFAIGGVGVGSSVADVLALMPNSERREDARDGKLELGRRLRLFELDGELTFTVEDGRVTRVYLELRGEPNKVAAVVADFMKSMSVFRRTGPDWWPAWYSAEGVPVASMHVWKDALIILSQRHD
jgi:hypothetical protein